MHIYIDETAYSGKEGELIGSGMLVTAEPVRTDVISSALTNLGDDPDRADPKTRKWDDATLGRGYFHASEDSANAHSWLARAIHSHVKGTFLFSYARRMGKGDERDFRTHAMHNLVRGLRTRQAVSIIFEQRSGFSNVSAATIIDALYSALDAAAYDLPMLPTYYPAVMISVRPKNEAGLQIVDLLLWATIQKNECPDKPKARVFSWCGLQFQYQAGPVAARAQYWSKYAVNNDTAVSEDESSLLAPYPVSPDTLDDATEEELVQYYCFAERCIHAAAAQSLPESAAHLSTMVKEASKTLQKQYAGPREIESVARTFIRLFDTMPIYDGVSPSELLRMVKARRFLGLSLRRDLLHGGRTLDYFTEARLLNVAKNPKAFGLPEGLKDIRD